jgi:hypothetical protein
MRARSAVRASDVDVVGFEGAGSVKAGHRPALKALVVAVGLVERHRVGHDAPGDHAVEAMMDPLLLD